MLSFRDFFNGLRKLGVNRTQPVIVHTSLSAFGEVQGGAETILGSLLAAYNTIIVPTFTYKTMITPEIGPPDNAIVYGSGKDTNRMAEFFTPYMPVDRLIGIIPETLRKHAHARRSSHPIQSFAGINADAFLDAQTLEEPLAPLRVLCEHNGWVVLMGVDHTVNTTIHYAEQLAGRKQFVRWALTPTGVVECPGWPGCSSGFQAIAPRLVDVTYQVQLGPTLIQAVPTDELIPAVIDAIKADPLALLCTDGSCERCQAARQAAVQSA